MLRVIVALSRSSTPSVSTALQTRTFANGARHSGGSGGRNGNRRPPQQQSKKNAEKSQASPLSPLNRNGLKPPKGSFNERARPLLQRDEREELTPLEQIINIAKMPKEPAQSAQAKRVSGIRKAFDDLINAAPLVVTSYGGASSGDSDDNLPSDFVANCSSDLYDIAGDTRLLFRANHNDSLLHDLRFLYKISAFGTEELMQLDTALKDCQDARERLGLNVPDNSKSADNHDEKKSNSSSKLERGSEEYEELYNAYVGREKSLLDYCDVIRREVANFRRDHLYSTAFETVERTDEVIKEALDAGVSPTVVVRAALVYLQPRVSPLMERLARSADTMTQKEVANQLVVADLSPPSKEVYGAPHVAAYVSPLDRRFQSHKKMFERLSQLNNFVAHPLFGLVPVRTQNDHLLFKPYHKEPSLNRRLPTSTKNLESWIEFSDLITPTRGAFRQMLIESAAGLSRNPSIGPMDKRRIIEDMIAVHKQGAVEAERERVRREEENERARLEEEERQRVERENLDPQLVRLRHIRRAKSTSATDDAPDNTSGTADGELNDDSDDDMGFDLTPHSDNAVDDDDKKN